MRLGLLLIKMPSKQIFKKNYKIDDNFNWNQIIIKFEI